MEELKRMRVLGSGVAAALVALSAGTAAWFDARVALGLLLGGSAGIVSFWLLAVRVARMAQAGTAAEPFFTLRGTLLRLAIYAVTLGTALALDSERYYALIAAVAGLLLMRPALMVVVFAGLRKRPDED